MSGGKPKLHYFNARGRAELIRLVFVASNVDFEDVRVARDQWPELKKKAPTGVMPYVECGAEKCALVQSGAIARYYAKKAGLMGSNDWEYYLVERVLSQIEDVMLEVMKFMFAPEDKKADLAKEFQTNKGPALLTSLVKFLKEGGAGFYVGKSITLADLASITLVDNLGGCGELLGKFPDLTEHKKAVLAANAKLAEHFKKRPETQF